MFCKNCGTKLDEDAKFCASCGGAVNKEALNEPEVLESTPLKEEQSENSRVQPEVFEPNTHEYSDPDSSVVRKAIKKDAKEKPRGPLMGAMALLIAIPVVLLLIFGVSIIGAAMTGSLAGTFATLGIFTLLMIMYLVLSLFVNFGIIRGSINISKGNNQTIGDVFAGPFKNAGSFAKYLLGTILYGFAFAIISMIPIVGPLIALAGQIYLLPVLFVFAYTFADDNYKQLSFTEAIKKSLELTKNHRVSFYAMIFSFLGWFLLGMVTFGLAMIFVMPYLQVSLANMYRNWLGEASYTNAEKGLSDGTVIGIGLAGYFATFIIIFFVAVIGIAGYLFANGMTIKDGEIYENGKIEENHEYNDIFDRDYRETDREFTLDEDDVRITLSVPTGYKIDTAYSDDEYVKLQSDDSSNTNRIYYQLKDTFGVNLDKEIQTIKNAQTAVAGNNKITENVFDTVINGINAKVYQSSISRSYGNSDVTYILYPLNNQNYIEVEINGILVNQTDINKYLIIK